MLRTLAQPGEKCWVATTRSWWLSVSLRADKRGCQGDSPSQVSRILCSPQCKRYSDTRLGYMGDCPRRSIQMADPSQRRGPAPASPRLTRIKRRPHTFHIKHALSLASARLLNMLGHIGTQSLTEMARARARKRNIQLESAHLNAFAARACRNYAQRAWDRMVPMDDLGLVETVDRLGESIVITVADAAHRRLDARLRQPLGLLDRDVLAAAVAPSARPQCSSDCCHRSPRSVDQAELEVLGGMSLRIINQLTVESHCAPHRRTAPGRGDLHFHAAHSA
jgi:hypothetical protein